jgi:hypothetical protein
MRYMDFQKICIRREHCKIVMCSQYSSYNSRRSSRRRFDSWVLRLARIARVELRDRGIHAAVNLRLDVTVPFSVATHCSPGTCRDFPTSVFWRIFCIPSPLLFLFSLSFSLKHPTEVSRVTMLQENSDQIMIRAGCLSWDPCPLCAQANTYILL